MVAENVSVLFCSLEWSKAPLFALTFSQNFHLWAQYIDEQSLEQFSRYYIK